MDGFLGLSEGGDAGRGRRSLDREPGGSSATRKRRPQNSTEPKGERRREWWEAEVTDGSLLLKDHVGSPYRPARCLPWCSLSSQPFLPSRRQPCAPSSYESCLPSRPRASLFLPCCPTRDARATGLPTRPSCSAPLPWPPTWLPCAPWWPSSSSPSWHARRNGSQSFAAWGRCHGDAPDG